MNYLLGEFECKVDAKGRFKVPSGLLKQLSGDAKEGGFVLSKSLDGCLELRTREQWDDMSDELNKLSKYKAENRKFLRFVFGGVKFMSLDGADRLLVPKELSEFAKVKQELVLSCIMDKVEVWPKEKYEDQMIDEDEAATIADQLNIEI